MKYIITLLIFCLPVIGYGQNKICIDTTTGVLTYQDTITPPKPDTIKVIMLVCDTTPQERMSFHLDGEFRIIPHIGFVYWQYGYETQTYYQWGFTITHLDADKRHLPKTTIVWQTKNINH